MWKKLLCLGLCGLSAMVCAQPQGLELEDCHVDGIKEMIQCGTISVPENYQQPDATQIALNINLIPAIDGSSDKIPLLFLAGGPGQAATELAAVLRKRFYEVRKSRDIILVDKRGTGNSSQLKCDLDAFNNLDIYSAMLMEVNTADIKDCINQIKQDMRQYNSENAIRDVDAVRAALGYEKINLYGGSYGTRAALIYMRMFPQSINSVVLDSVAPLDMRIGLFGKSAERSFQKLLDNCQADESCKLAFPNLAQDFQSVYARLLSDPVQVTIPHPRLATPTRLVIDETKFLSNIQLQLYSSQGRSIVPLLINEAAKDNFMPLVGVLAQSDEQQPPGAVYMNVLMNIACNEDFPLISDGAWAEDADNQFARNLSHRHLRLICPLWPSYRPSDSFYQPITADIPTLVLSGDLDPVTPPEFGEMADKMLPNSRHIVAQKLSHIVASNDCGVGLVAQFIDELEPDSVDDSCLAELPDASFMTSLNGNM